MSTIKINNAYIDDSYTIIGKFESSGLLKNIDFILKDNYFGEKTFEDAEIKMQKTVIEKVLFKNRVELIIGGDLSNQLSCISRAVEDNNISFLGVYSACSSFIESLLISSLLIKCGCFSKTMCLTSSHNCNSEKQFRFPVEYGSPKVKRSTYTLTGAVGCVVKNQVSKLKIESVTIGKVINSTIKDANNMGAVMALGAFDTLVSHLKDLKRDINYYDYIITGDLGKAGQDMFNELLINDNLKPKKYFDAGTIIYNEKQNVGSGASGPTVLPVVFFSKYTNLNNKKILLIGTGSMHNTTLVNQKKEIPCISHAISIEVK